jgi:hypothetical protein
MQSYGSTFVQSPSLALGVSIVQYYLPFLAYPYALDDSDSCSVESRRVLKIPLSQTFSDMHDDEVLPWRGAQAL